MLNQSIRALTACLIFFSFQAYGGGHSTFVFGGPTGVGVVSFKNRGHHRPTGFVAAGVMSGSGSLSCNPNPYNPYIPYWSSFPTSNYYDNSFGYWSPSNGSYGSYYTQPGMYKAYTYGPYNYSTSYVNSPFFNSSCSPSFNYFTPNYGIHTGLYNFAYSKIPGQGYSLFGTGPYGNSFYYSGLGR